MHEDKTRANVACELHFMSDHDQRHTFTSQRTDHSKHILHQFWVQCRRNFIAKQGNRFHSKRTGDGYPLLLTTRQFVRVSIELVAKTYPFEHLSGDLCCFVFGRFLDHCLRQHHIAASGEMREEIEMLEDHPNLETQGFQVYFFGRQMTSSYRDRTVINHFEPVNAAQQCRFTRATLADYGYNFTALDIQICESACKIDPLRWVMSE